MANMKYADTPETLLKAILSMQDKIIESQPEYEAAELTYVAEFGNGAKRILPNPVVTEFRALVKDYASVLKVYKEISGNGEPLEGNRLSELRQRLKVTA